ncbi:E3 ubiquitin-protein ligase TRIM39-like isoform X2 [Lissotriton helveticus]
MAEANGFLDLLKFSTCSICDEPIQYPVALECGHHFCTSCVSQSWEKRGDNFPCPECGLISPRRELFSNWLPQGPGGELKQEEPNICIKHEQPLQMFCEDDQELICSVCWTSADHQMHSVSKMEQAGLHYKAKLQELLYPLKQEIEYKLKEEQQHETMMDVRSTLKRCKEAQVQKQEVKVKSKTEQAVKSKTEQAVKSKTEQAVKSKTEQAVKSTVGTEKCVKRRSLPKPGHVIKRYQVTITLDPDTAHPELVVLGCRRLVKAIVGKPSVPDNPKRFMNYRCVLGSKGFTSGKHYWEVLLLYGGYNWSVGVAAESVNRKEYFKWSPKESVWALKKCGEDYCALGCQQVPLSVNWRIEKLGVYLDYEEGQLSFYNAGTSNHLYTFTCMFFPCKIFPIFDVGGSTEMRLQ